MPNIGDGYHGKNCVSVLVSKNRSQKFINSSYLNNGVDLLCFVFASITVVIDIIMVVIVSFLHTYKISRSSLVCKALFILINFLVLWLILLENLFNPA